MHGCDYLAILHYLCFMNDVNFETTVFNTPTNQYIKSILLQMLVKWCWIPIILVLCCVILAYMVNVAFIYVALMLLFIIIPSALMFAYFYHSSSSEARVAVLRKSIKINDSGVLVNFESIEVVDYGDSSKSKVYQPQSEFYPQNNIASVFVMGKYVRINLKGGSYKFINIPLKEIKGNVNDFLAYILQYNEQNIE